MANTLVTCTIVAKESLAILKNMLTFSKAVNRDWQDEFTSNMERGYAPGSTINIRIESSVGVNRGQITGLSVSNSGPQIDASDLPRLFDRFYRADPAREHGDANHGLGLSIVAAIARMHGGQTHARSEGGKTSIGFDMATR